VRFTEGGVFVYGVGTTPGEGGDRGSGVKECQEQAKGECNGEEFPRSVGMS
jgi:hypothetical protein